MKLSSSPSLLSTVLAGAFAASLLPSHAMGQQHERDDTFDMYLKYREPIEAPCVLSRYALLDFNKIPTDIRGKIDQAMKDMRFLGGKVNRDIIQTTPQAYGHFMCSVAVVVPEETEKTLGGMTTKVEELTKLVMPEPSQDVMNMIQRYLDFGWKMTKGIGGATQLPKRDDYDSYPSRKANLVHDFLRSGKLEDYYKIYQADASKGEMNIGFIDKEGIQVLPIALKELKRQAKSIADCTRFLAQLDTIQRENKFAGNDWYLRSEVYQLILKLDPTQAEPLAQKLFVEAGKEDGKGNRSNAKDRLLFIAEYLENSSVAVDATKLLVSIKNTERIEDANSARGQATRDAQRAMEQAGHEARRVEDDRQDFEWRMEAYRNCMKKDGFMCIKPYVY